MWVLNRDEQQLLEKGKPVEIVVVSKKELPARAGTDYTVEYYLDNKLYSIHVNRPFYDDVKKGDTFEGINKKHEKSWKLKLLEYSLIFFEIYNGAEVEEVTPILS
ncbi:hypothetical protein [Bacillus pseudomycoides]|uniref:hypothetical protein n=1 Tax=Bacillus pseudomycoides TaxID=64104 RepID=UPI00211D66A2|nr:hypothetical protein [Bacillus pseudomycoides]